MPRRRGHELGAEKIPIREQIYRWLDILTFFDYSSEVRNKSFKIVWTSNYIRKARGKPSVIAAACLYLADGECWKPRSKNYWKYEKVKKIIHAKRLRNVNGKLFSEPTFDISLRFDTLINTANKIKESGYSES